MGRRGSAAGVLVAECAAERVLDRREHAFEGQPERLEGDQAGERDQRREKPVLDRGRAARVGGEVVNGPHVVPMILFPVPRRR